MKLHLGVAALLLGSTTPLAWTQAAKQVPGPSLYGGCASPTSIPNHAITEVKLAGHNFTGATVTADGGCTLHSFAVDSDLEISLKLEGNLAVDAADDGCFLHIHRAGKATGTFVVVELTEQEAQQKNAAEIAAAQAKAGRYVASLGSQWILHFADGSSETLTAQPPDPGQLPDFTSSTGGTAKIMMSGGKVVIVKDGCVRTGTVTGDQVKDGTVTGECAHGASWTGHKR